MFANVIKKVLTNWYFNSGGLSHRGRAGTERQASHRDARLTKRGRPLTEKQVSPKGPGLSKNGWTSV